MNITCKIDDDLPQDVEELITRRAGFTLSKFADVIHDVAVTVADQNGPRGGVDMLCVLRIKVRGLPLIVIQETAATPQNAVIGAFDRASRTVARRCRRRSESYKPARRRELSHRL